MPSREVSSTPKTRPTYAPESRRRTIELAGAAPDLAEGRRGTKRAVAADAVLSGIDREKLTRLSRRQAGTPGARHPLSIGVGIARRGGLQLLRGCAAALGGGPDVVVARGLSGDLAGAGVHGEVQLEPSRSDPPEASTAERCLAAFAGRASRRLLTLAEQPRVGAARAKRVGLPPRATRNCWPAKGRPRRDKVVWSGAGNSRPSSRSTLAVKPAAW